MGFGKHAGEARVAAGAAERYYDLVQSLDAIVWEARAPALDLTFVSQRAASILGYSAEEWIGDPGFWTRHVHPDDRERVIASRRDAAREGRGYEEAYRALARDGRTVWLHDMVRFVPGTGKRPALLRGLTVDVTERRRTEEALRTSEARKAAVVEAALDCIISIDADGRVIEFNPAAERVFGYSREEAIGREMAELIIPPRMREAHRRGLRHYLATGEGPVLGKRLEMPALRADGSELPVELTIARIEADGAPVFTGFVRDISERKRAERALREEVEFTTALLDTIGALVIVVDTEGRFVRFNKECERITGYSLDEVKGRTFWDIVLLPEERDAVRAVFDELRAGRFPSKNESCWVAKDGARRLISWSNTCLVGPDGRVQYVIGTGLDVTDQRRLEGELRQTQKMDALGRLAGGVAHDFNNLLTIVQGYCERLLRPGLAPEAQERAVHEIGGAAEKAARLTRQLLAFSRKQAVDLQVLDLNSVVADMEKMLRRIIGEDVELQTAIEPGLGKIQGNRGQLEQVVVNLVVNARDAMPEGGKLTVETANVEIDERYARRHVAAKPGPYVMLAVTDSGVGMTSEVQTKIFEPFFTTKEAGRGTGLGLSTVYGIVKQRGGHIWVYTERGRGTTFKVYFPRATEPVADEARPEPAGPPRGGTETVLVVEDERAIRALVQDTLGSKGYAILEAKDGEEALALLGRHEGPIHLLVTDVVMPRMGGRELAHRLRRLRPDLRVLYISGYADAAVLHHDVIEPGMSYLQKPFTPDALARKVREVLDASVQR